MWYVFPLLLLHFFFSFFPCIGIHALREYGKIASSPIVIVPTLSFRGAFLSEHTPIYFLHLWRLNVCSWFLKTWVIIVSSSKIHQSKTLWKVYEQNIGTNIHTWIHNSQNTNAAWLLEESTLMKDYKCQEYRDNYCQRHDH